jgi:hypothetical protein
MGFERELIALSLHVTFCTQSYLGRGTESTRLTGVSLPLSASGEAS